MQEGGYYRLGWFLLRVALRRWTTVILSTYLVMIVGFQFDLHMFDHGGSYPDWGA